MGVCHIRGRGPYIPTAQDIYLAKLSDQNLVRFYLPEIHDISIIGPKKYHFSGGVRRTLHKLGVLKRTKDRRCRVDWDRIWKILGVA